MAEFQIEGEPWRDEGTIQIGISDEGSYFITITLDEAESLARSIQSEVVFGRRMIAAKGDKAERMRLIAERAGFPDAKTWLDAEKAKLESLTDNAEPLPSPSS